MVFVVAWGATDTLGSVASFPNFLCLLRYQVVGKLLKSFQYKMLGLKNSDKNWKNNISCAACGKTGLNKHSKRKNHSIVCRIKK